MAEDFRPAGIWGGNWLMNASKSSFTGSGGPSPCSIGNDLLANGSYDWPSSCKDHLWNGIIDNTIIESPSSQSHPQQGDSDDHSGDGDGDGDGSSMLMDSALHMMGFNLNPSSSTSSPDWNQALMRNNSSTGRGQAYSTIFQEDMDLGLHSSPETQKGWAGTTSNYAMSSTTTGPSCGCGGGGLGEDDDDDPSLHIGPFKTMCNYKEPFPLGQQISVDNNPTATCQGLSSSGFHMGPSTYGYPSSLIHTLNEHDSVSPRQQQSLLMDNRSSINYYEPPSSWPNTHKIPSSPPPPRPLGTRQQQASSSSGWHFSNNAPYWNASDSGYYDDNTNGGGNFLPLSQPQYVAAPGLEEKYNCNSNPAKIRNDEDRNLGSVAKKGTEPAFKRPRIETPSPLPTFKVRKEKLGDRITALQQLVSPFGKTDTASVLHEGIEYIKYLHDQVNVLSTPYMKNSNFMQHQLQQGVDRQKDPEETRQDLRSRGLCLVPISSTFPVASETTCDFWTPTFGGAFG